MTKQTLIRRIGERVRSIFTKDPTAVTDRVEERSSKIDYRDIVGYGDFDKHYRDRLHSLRHVIREQEQCATLFGKLFGFQKLCALAAQGKTDDVIRKIEKTTRHADRYLYSEFEGSRELYDGASKHRPEKPLPKRKPYRYIFGYSDNPFRLDFLEICLFGAKIAELAGDYQGAFRLYNRAGKAIDPEDCKYSDYAKVYQERNRMWKSGRKRVAKLMMGERK